jgi:hypothetical protein
MELYNLVYVLYFIVYIVRQNRKNKIIFCCSLAHFFMTSIKKAEHQDMIKKIVNKNRKTDRWPKIKIKNSKIKHVAKQKKSKDKHVAKKRRTKTNMWPRKEQIRVITKLPNSEQSYKGKVKTHKYINRQNQSTTGKL